MTRWASRLLVGLALTTGLTLGAAAPAVATTPVLPAVAVPSVVLAVPAGVAGMLPGPAVPV
ncbi:hypothetical protein, partial [Micromonospora sp. NPDC049799]|uniref:hypothetical protein n=1 Tax=Micromonospora sp. NPDC049799 TaxID=3154741 RepID=UPI00340E0B5E